jgi:hypothetical protein
MTADPVDRAVDFRSSTPPVSRTVVVLGGVGALLQLVGGLIETVDRVRAGEPGFAVRTTVIAFAYLLLATTVLALARVEAAGPGRAARSALVVAGSGWLLSAIAQLVLSANVGLAEKVLFPVATIAIGGGMTVAGVAVLRSHRWRRWRRWVPLVCGVYPFAVIFPVFAAAGEPNFLVLSGWGLCWLVLSAAIWGAVEE